MNKILLSCLLVLFAYLPAQAQLTNRVFSQTTTSNMIYTNIVALSNNLSGATSNTFYGVTNSVPFQSVFLGINTNLSVLRPGPFTNTLIFSNGILIHIASTNVPF